MCVLGWRVQVVDCVKTLIECLPWKILVLLEFKQPRTNAKSKTMIFPLCLFVTLHEYTSIYTYSTTCTEEDLQYEGSKEDFEGKQECLLLRRWGENWATKRSSRFTVDLGSDPHQWSQALGCIWKNKITYSWAGWLAYLCMIGWRVQQFQSASIYSHCFQRFTEVYLSGSSTW